MPSLDKLASQPIKLMLIGDPGAGKTGSLASLADAGYNLRIYDLDNGGHILLNLLMDQNTPYAKDAWKRVVFQTITENNVNLSAVMNALPKGATVINRLFSQLSHWKTEDEDLGPISEWGPRDVLVIDSMTLLGTAAMNFSKVQNAGNSKMDPRMHFLHAQDWVEGVAMKLYGTDIKCNVVICSHIRWVSDQSDRILHGYPMTVGQALSAKIGRYFNTILMVKTIGTERRIYTRPVLGVELKNSAPLKVKEFYGITHGLAEVFRDIQGSPGFN